MSITVDYSLLPGLERTGVLAPMIPITFKNGVYEFLTFALVDSGAESAVISTVVADALNIDWHAIPKQTGLSTAGNFIYHPVTSIEAEIFDYSFGLKINIIEGINAFKCILGRKDLFKKAKITFEGYKNQFQIDFRQSN